MREIHSVWGGVQFNNPQSYKEWLRKLKESEKVRTELFSALDLASKNDERLAAWLSKIREGTSPADSIQDLNDLSVTAHDKVAVLTAITNFDPAYRDQAAALSNEMGALLAAATLDLSDSPEFTLRRNKLYAAIQPRALLRRERPNKAATW
jgi:hypothetical protein